MPKRAEGGSTEAGQFSRWTTDELQNFLDTPTNPKAPFDKVLNLQNIQNTIKARRQADKSGGAAEKRARGGATDEPRKTKQLDAREAALYSNGVDKVAEGSHREEREVPEEEREDGDDATNKMDDFYLKTWDGSINPKQMFLARPSKFGADADYRRADGGSVAKAKFEVDDDSAQNKGDLGPSRGKAPQYENDEDKDKRASGGWIGPARDKMERKGTVGSLHKALHVSEGTRIPSKRLEEARKDAGPALRKKIQFAENVRK